MAGILSFASMACSNINEDDRLINVMPDTPDNPDDPSKPEKVNKAVLIEDYTGQKCINCPKGTEAINSIVEAYGEDKVIPVGIHSGPLGFKGNKKFPLGLMTDTGNEYYNKWDSEKKIGQPWALFNRSTAPNSEYSTWAGSVFAMLSKEANLSINIDNAYNAETRTLTTDIDALGVNGVVNGKLQVWIIEDGIVAMQYMPDGSVNAQYVHNHVFRAAVNGTWGEDVTVKEGEHTKKQYTFKIDDKWNVARVSVVAFVYTDNGVEQVAKKQVAPEAN